MSEPSETNRDFILRGAPGTGQPRLLRSYKVEFKGTAGEYFRIWVVNTCLTLLTCGVYLAWAKVRKRRYFYNATLLDGRPFSYTADPKAIFKGYLIIAVCVILINVTNFVHPLLNLVATLLFGVAFPFLIYKSLRFRARNTVYRNIPFRFQGGAGESYRIFFFSPILIPVTLGLFLPYWEYLRKRYFYANMGYGSAYPEFSGQPRFFYLFYLVGLVMTGVLVVIFFFFFFPLISSGIHEILMQLPPERWKETRMALTLVMGLILAFAAMGLFKVFLYAKTTAHCLEHTTLGKVQFICSLSALRLLWIQAGNLVAVLFSVGLLAPWAQVRRHRYIAESISVVSDASLEEITAGIRQQNLAAVGDAATDFFDMEIGL